MTYLEQYFPVHNTIKVECTNNSCSHFPACAQIPTQFFTYPNYGIDILFIGQGGGEEEEKNNLPFIGDAGQRLRALVKWIMDDGVRFSVAFSNNVRCRPTHPETKKNRDPYPEEIAKCYMYLDRDIGLLQPKVIVPLGNNCTKALIPMAKGKISEDHGKFFRIKMWNRMQLAMPTFHPSFLIRNGKKFHLHETERKIDPNPYDIIVKNDLICALNYIRTNDLT